MSYVLQHWSAAWPALAAWVVVATLHLMGLRRLGMDRHRAKEAVAFQSGLLLALLAVVSPLGYWAGRYIWVRSIQDLLLAFTAAPLIVLGAPWEVLAGRTSRPAGRQWWLVWPVAVVVAFNVIWLGWHIAPLYDLSATNTAVRYLEYVCYLGAGILFWLQLIGSRPSRPTLPPMRRMAMLVATAAADAILGMVLVFGSGVLYPVYRGPSHHALSVVSDQQIAGAVLWMGVLPALIIAAVALINGWLDLEESDELSRDLDRVLGRAPEAPAASGERKVVWPARAGYRRPTTR
jgi:putative membrane protein